MLVCKMSCPRIFSWSCRGAGCSNFLRFLLFYIQCYSHEILILMETRVDSSMIHKISAKSQFSRAIWAEASGFAGGIWVLWDEAVVCVEPISVDSQIVNCVVKRGPDPPWILSTVYASPHPLIHHDLWSYISQLGHTIAIPWLLVGGFNQVLHGREKKGGRRPNGTNLRLFQNCVHDCSLLDIGFVGSSFTWLNMRCGMAKI